MFYHIFYPLAKYSIIFNLFRYITFRTMYASVTSFVLTVILLPPFIKKIRAAGLGEKINEYAPETHKEKEGTPTGGGIIFVISVVIATLLWANLENLYIYTAILVTVYLAIFGLIDDLAKIKGIGNHRGLPAWIKIVGHVILSFFVLFMIYKIFPEGIRTKTQILFFKNFLLDFKIFYILFVLVVFIGATNSVNLTDGLDGLAAGAAIPTFGVFLIVTYITGNKILSSYLHLLYFNGAGELSIFAGAFMGALLGFLWFNAHPADVFMGDTGSQSIGGALGILSILTKQEFLLAIAGFLFVIEALSVIIQCTYFRVTGGKRVFLRSPIHHHFELLGWDENKIVVRFWIISAIFAVIAISTLKIR